MQPSFRRSAARLALVYALLPALAMTAAAQSPAQPPAQPSAQPSAIAPMPRPLVIGHRGAAGHLPEHTLEGYALAIALGADFIEPDLVSTKDHVLIARHENELSDTTDVADKFPARKRVASIDGRAAEGWFSEDFTLAEIKTLRAKERLPFRDHSRDGQYGIPTLQEIIDLARRKGAELGRPIGIYPETKHPHYFRNIQLPLEDALLAVLDRNGLNRADAPVFIQSFEVWNLKELARKTRVPLIQLIGPPERRPFDFTADPRTYGDMIAPAGLKEIATYARGIGPEKSLILPLTPGRELKAPTALVRDAHAAGLLVHPYTFRREARFLAKDYFANGEAGAALAEYRKFYELGVDGVFSDFADDAVQARAAFLKK
jgi:glycerophosphoryl diester phosphodiesterase